jgi:hypothetical protein
MRHLSQFGVSGATPNQLAAPGAPGNALALLNTSGQRFVKRVGGAREEGGAGELKERSAPWKAI